MTSDNNWNAIFIAKGRFLGGATTQLATAVSVVTLVSTIPMVEMDTLGA